MTKNSIVGHNTLYWIQNELVNCPIVKIAGKWEEVEFYHGSSSAWEFIPTTSIKKPNIHDLFLTYEEAFKELSRRVNAEVDKMEDKIKLNRERLTRLKTAFETHKRQVEDVKNIDLSKLTYEQRQSIKAAVQAMELDPDSTPITVYYNINKGIRSDYSGKWVTNTVYFTGLNNYVKFRTGDKKAG